MNIGVVGILVVFAAFIVLLIANPRLSCFGRKLASPFYPLFRRKRMEADARRLRQERLKSRKTEDYGFKLDDSAESGSARLPVPGKARKDAKTGDDYGLKLD